MKRILFRSISVVALCILFASCKSQKINVNQKKSYDQQDFVKVNGTKFMINNKPYYYVGTNFWYGAYLGADADYGNRERLLRELDHLQKLGINNLRIVAASEESDFGLPLSPPFQYKNGTYNETLFHSTKGRIQYTYLFEKFVIPMVWACYTMALWCLCSSWENHYKSYLRLPNWERR